MAEGARLESVYTFTRIEGSNPSLTAKIHKHVITCCKQRFKSKGFKPFLLSLAINFPVLKSPLGWGYKWG